MYCFFRSSISSLSLVFTSEARLVLLETRVISLCEVQDPKVGDGELRVSALDTFSSLLLFDRAWVIVFG